MPCRVFRRLIDFDKYKPSRVILLLYDIKTIDTGFLDTGQCVRGRDLFEGLDGLWLDVDVNVDNEHGKLSFWGIYPSLQVFVKDVFWSVQLAYRDSPVSPSASIASKVEGPTAIQARFAFFS